MTKQIIFQFIVYIFLILILALPAACGCQSNKTSTPTTAVTPNSTSNTSPVPGTATSVPVVVPVSPITGKTASATPADTTAPVVVSVSPINFASGVAISSKISVTFNELMDVSAISTSTFKVSGDINGKVDCNGITLTFIPSAGLAYATLYTVTLTTGIKDLAGNALKNDFVWSFTTTPGPIPLPENITATTPPVIISTTPSNLAVDVATNTNVTVAFSEEMDPSTINQETFTLKKGIIQVLGTVQCSKNTATFKPPLALEHSTTYTAALTTGAKDLSGNPLDEGYRWSFTTVAAPSGGGGGANPPPHTSTPTPTKSQEIRTMTLTDADLPQPPIQGMTLCFLAPLQGEAGPGKLQASYGLLTWSVWFGADNGKLWVSHVPKRDVLPPSLQSFYDYLGIDQYTTYTEQNGRYWFTGIPPWLNIAQYDPDIIKMPTLISIESTSGQVTVSYILN